MSPSRLYCSNCNETIPRDVFEYSMDKFGAALCREHQPMRRSWTPRATPEAKRLAEALRARGLEVQLEKFDGYKHIDIAINEFKIHIEVDGFTHTVNPKRALADLQRNYYDFLRGYLTLHIPNCLVDDDETLNDTADFISKFIKRKEA